MYGLQALAWALARQYRVPSLAVAVSVVLSASTQAAVTVSADPVDRFGASPAVFTVDPFTAVPEAASRANRGVTQDRRLRQTFKNPSPFNVGEINLSFDVNTGGTPGSAGDTGIRLAFYEVDDVLGAWQPGALVKEVTIPPGVLPMTTEILRISLTGGDVFALAQRDAGNTGYGLEISTPNALSSDGNPGVLWFTNQDGDPSPVMDYYAGGRYYTESGPSSAFRDVGLSLVASLEAGCDPGDVNCMDGVDEVDLGIIAAHFRTNGAREQGDLTGDGFIDFDDFGEWKQYYMGPGLAASAFSFLSVPEPASAVLLILAGAAIPGRKKRIS